MYKGFLMVVRKGQAMEIIKSTNNPFEWFPELKIMFDNLDVKNMVIDLETDNPDLERKIFTIKKLDK